jgi:hypothetical protein
MDDSTGGKGLGYRDTQPDGNEDSCRYGQRKDRAGWKIFLVIPLVQPETMRRYRNRGVFHGRMMWTRLLYTRLSLKVIKGFYGEEYPIHTNQK